MTTGGRRRLLLPLLSAALLLLSLAPGGAGAFSNFKSAAAVPLPAVERTGSTPRSALSAGGGGVAGGDVARASNSELKVELLERIKTLRSIKERDGDFSIDFGVKGGEIDEKSRAPQKVNFYSISDDAGRAADVVKETAQRLASSNPTDEPTLHLGDRDRGNESPLDGEWRLLFTTAADATFSRNSTRGYATAKNVVDAARGRITNVIDFATAPDGTEPTLKQLNVVIAATAAGARRVELRFRYAKAVISRIFGWKRRWSLYIPVPAPFVTRLIVFFSRIIRFGRGKEKRVPPKAYFDVLYLDGELRIHRTGEDNLFIQAKDTWAEARPLLS